MNGLIRACFFQRCYEDKRESRQQASEAQRQLERRRARARDKKQRRQGTS